MTCGDESLEVWRWKNVILGILMDDCYRKEDIVESKHSDWNKLKKL
jgi:hypothetical protein